MSTHRQPAAAEVPLDTLLSWSDAVTINEVVMHGNS